VKARELQEEARLLAIRQEEERRRQQELEQQRREVAELERRHQQELEQLARRRDELRREIPRLCRNLDFLEAKTVITPMTGSRHDEFQRWAVNEKRTVELAERAFDLVRNSDTLLAGLRVSVKGSPRPAQIAAIGLRDISAEIREQKYERGVLIGEQVQRHTIPLAEIETSQMLRYIEAAWQRQNAGGPQDLSLLKGAYLLARAEELVLSERYLRDSGMTAQVEPMLTEIAALRELGVE